jgi:hypothetical protein
MKREVYTSRGQGELFCPALVENYHVSDLHVILTPTQPNACTHPTTIETPSNSPHRHASYLCPHTYMCVHLSLHSIAWAGGRITSNKEEAMIQFLRRKQGQSVSHSVKW